MTTLDTEPLLLSSNTLEESGKRRIRIEKGSFSYLSRNSASQGKGSLLWRSMCSVLLFTVVIGFFLFVWELDYMQPERIPSQYPFKSKTTKNVTLQPFGFAHKNLTKHFFTVKKSDINIVKTTTASLYKDQFQVKNKVEMKQMATGSEKSKNIKDKKSDSFKVPQDSNTKSQNVLYGANDFNNDLSVKKFVNRKVNIPVTKKVDYSYNNNIKYQVLKNDSTINGQSSAGSNMSTNARKMEIYRNDLSRTTRVPFHVAKKVTMMATRHPASHYITLDFQGRLGNLLFQYASLYGIADKNNLFPVTTGSLELYRYFQVTMSKERRAHRYENTYREKKGCTFEPAVMNLGENKNYKLWGYYQSWKYFKHIEEKLRKEFRFNIHISKMASDQFSAITSQIIDSSKRNVTYVAVHVRRGDMTTNKVFLDYGYKAADVDYVTRGMQYFKSRFQNVIFIMASDDLQWCRRHFTSTDVKFVRPHNSAATDMAILTKCHHALITVGSYGWWVGWIINGVTVYYKDYPKKGSKLDWLFSPEDYIPPNWIGM